MNYGEQSLNLNNFIKHYYRLEILTSLLNRNGYDNKEINKEIKQ